MTVIPEHICIGKDWHEDSNLKADLNNPQRDLQNSSLRKMKRKWECLLIIACRGSDHMLRQNKESSQLVKSEMNDL